MSEAAVEVKRLRETLASIVYETTKPNGVITNDWYYESVAAVNGLATRALDDEPASSIAVAETPELRPVVMADRITPADPGPYYVGYGEEWTTFDSWDDAWAHHVMRGTTYGSSHIKVAA